MSGIIEGLFGGGDTPSAAPDPELERMKREREAALKKEEEDRRKRADEAVAAAGRRGRGSLFRDVSPSGSDKVGT